MVFVSVTESVVSVAVYVTVSALTSVTVKVTRPFESLGPDAPEMTELAEPGWVSETILPATGFDSASLSVTVTVDVVEPSAVTLAGAAPIVDTDALTDPAAVEIIGLVPVRFVGVVLSVAVTV
jgi:hypothetical protein